MVSRSLLTDSALPASSTAASLAAAARRCEALRQARRLASWVAKASASRRSTCCGRSTCRQRHRPWKVALAVGFLRIVDGRAVIGPALGQWPDADADTVRELWLTGLTAAFAANSSSDDEAGAVAFSRVTLRALVTDPPLSFVDFWARAREALMFENTYAADPFINAYGRRDALLAAVSDVLIGFGAATRHGQQLTVTPLGRWALQELNARMPKPISADLPAEELIVQLADYGGNDAWHAAAP